MKHTIIGFGPDGMAVVITAPIAEMLDEDINEYMCLLNCPAYVYLKGSGVENHTTGTISRVYIVENQLFDTKEEMMDIVNASLN